MYKHRRICTPICRANLSLVPNLIVQSRGEFISEMFSDHESPSSSDTLRLLHMWTDRLLFVWYCKSCSLDTCEPGHDIGHWTSFHSHCRVSGPSCYDIFPALVWKQPLGQASSRHWTYHKLILSRQGRSTGNAASSPSGTPNVSCDRKAER